MFAHFPFLTVIPYCKNTSVCSRSPMFTGVCKHQKETNHFCGLLLFTSSHNSNSVAGAVKCCFPVLDVLVGSERRFKVIVCSEKS